MADDLPTAGGDPAPVRLADALDASALAHRPDFEIGKTVVRASIRTIEGPSGAVACEPRVMQVLLALADAKGAVLSRNDLLRLCWSDRIVGEDAVNRAIAALRRAASAAGADFGVETIPRIGYRIASESVDWDGNGEPPSGDNARIPARGPGARSRRALIMGSAAAAAILGAGIWRYASWRDRAEYLDKVEQARRELAAPEGLAKAQMTLEELVAKRPDRAQAWGLLAYATYRSAEIAPFQQTGALVNASERAAARALALDAGQSDALFAMTLIQFSLAGWMESEQRIRRVIDLAPLNTEAIDFLVVLLQCAGRCRESREWLDRAVAIDPTRPELVFKKALKHWIFGEIPDADRVIDRALQLWPRYEWIWNTRLMIYAFTGRPLAAISMLDDSANRPASMTPGIVNVWRTALTAIDTRSGPDIAMARDIILKSAPLGPAYAGQGVMLLSSLGELDAAFEIAEGLLLAQGANVGSLQASLDGGLVNGQSWRRTQWLFTPATAALRADERFKGICAGLGLLDYWRKSGVWPDKFVLGSLASEVFL